MLGMYSEVYDKMSSKEPHTWNLDEKIQMLGLYVLCESKSPSNLVSKISMSMLFEWAISFFFQILSLLKGIGVRKQII